MTRSFSYISIGMFFIFIQAAVLPLFLECELRPNLLLLLVLYLGLCEKPFNGAVHAWLLGCLLDVFSGMTLGQSGMVMLLIFCLTRGGGFALNLNNRMAMLVATALGTTAHSLLVVILLLFFAEVDQRWLLVLQQWPVQTLSNLLMVLLMLPLLRSIITRRCISVATPKKGIVHGLE